MSNMKKELKEHKSQQPSHDAIGPEYEVNCYVCGRSGHLGRDCYFKNQSGGDGRGRGNGFQRESQGPSKNQQGRLNGTKRKSNNSGIFKNAQICEKNVKLLVDTGATLTILNDSLYNSLKTSFAENSKQ